MNLKEKFSSVDVRSAGIGAAALLAAQVATYGIYKGAKGIYHLIKGDNKKN